MASRTALHLGLFPPRRRWQGPLRSRPCAFHLLRRAKVRADSLQGRSTLGSRYVTIMLRYFYAYLMAYLQHITIGRCVVLCISWNTNVGDGHVCRAVSDWLRTCLASSREFSSAARLQYARTFITINITIQRSIVSGVPLHPAQLFFIRLYFQIA